MGLLNARNLKKAKAALDNNRDKVADAVGKAATGLDKATKGKTAGVSAKATAAARKYAGENTTSSGASAPSAAATPADPADPTAPKPPASEHVMPEPERPAGA